MPITLSYYEGLLLLDGLAKKNVDDLFSGSIWKWDARLGQFSTYAFRHTMVAKVLQNSYGAEFTDNVARPLTIKWPINALRQPRRDQKDAIAAWLEAGKQGLVVMPTGTGKTDVALHLMAHLCVSTLVVAPVRDLMYQWHHRIHEALGVEAGILGDSHHNVSPVTVTTYDSAAIYADSIGNRFGLVVFDEVHHLPSDLYRDAARMSTAPYRLGLTATPERTDGRHVDLTWLIGPEVFRRKLADAKHVAPYSIVRVPVQLTPAERDTYDFAARELAAWFADKKKSNKKYEIQDLLIDANFDTEARRVKKLYYTKKSIEDRADEKLRVLEDIFRLHAGERTLVFTGSNAMALDISRRFLLPTILSHSGKTERREVLDGFAKGEFPVLIANEVLDEGVDVPSAKVAVVTGGDTSIRQAKQRLGRILRERGTAKAVLYEIVCDGTSEVARSRKRRKNDAYGRTKHRKI